MCATLRPRRCVNKEHFQPLGRSSAACMALELCPVERDKPHHLAFGGLVHSLVVCLARQVALFARSERINNIVENEDKEVARIVQMGSSVQNSSALVLMPTLVADILDSKEEPTRG